MPLVNSVVYLCTLSVTFAATLIRGRTGTGERIADEIVTILKELAK
jgi:hypothetical protein